MKNCLFYCVLLIGLISCNSAKNGSETKNRVIVVSILPQKYLAERIAGEHFEIVSLLPPGASPATYSPTPENMRAVSDANLYFAIGHTGFELANLEKFKSLNEKLKIVETNSDIIWISDEDHDGVNPHIWMSPKNLMILARIMFEEIAKTDMIHFADYEKNYRQLQHELEQLNYDIKRDLEGLENKKFLIFHPALSYYASDYNLEEIALEHHGKKPSMAQMKSVLDMARENNIKAIFIQEQFDTEIASTIAEELNADIIQINPLEYNIIDELKGITIKMKQSLN